MDHCYHAQSTPHQLQHPEPVSSRTLIWWPTEISEPSQRDSGTIPCSEEQKQVPIHWAVSRASPCWLLYSTLLELQVNNIQRHKLLKMQTKLLVAGAPTACSDVHGVSTSISFEKVALQVREDYRNWVLPVLTFFSMDGTLRGTGTFSDFVKVKSPVLEAFMLKDWMHMGQCTLKKSCNWQVIFCSKETTEIWRLSWLCLTHMQIHTKLILTPFYNQVKQSSFIIIQN